MKLKDKKVEIMESQYISDKKGNRKKELLTIATLQTYFRQLSEDEIYWVITQTEETVMFWINYRYEYYDNTRHNVQ